MYPNTLIEIKKKSIAITMVHVKCHPLTTITQDMKDDAKKNREHYVEIVKPRVTAQRQLAKEREEESKAKLEKSVIGQGNKRKEEFEEEGDEKKQSVNLSDGSKNSQNNIQYATNNDKL